MHFTSCTLPSLNIQVIIQLKENGLIKYSNSFTIQFVDTTIWDEILSMVSLLRNKQTTITINQQLVPNRLT